MDDLYQCGIVDCYIICGGFVVGGVKEECGVFVWDFGFVDVYYD